MSNKVAICELCGEEYVKVSNRQKYCPDCKQIAKCNSNKKYNRKLAAKDIKAVSLGASLPNKDDPDWEAESRKIAAEKKRLYRSGKAAGSVSAREIALENLVYDQNEDDFKGSIDDFFAMKDD